MTPLQWIRSRGSVWRDYWFRGEWELRELHRYVDRRRGAVDIGGNVGVYTYHLARLARWVRVFEPDPHFADRIEAWGLRNATIERIALSSRSGEAALRIPRDARGEEDPGMASLQPAAVADVDLSRIVTVPVRPLDSYDLRDVGFIKIDAEGHEEAIVAGSAETIARDRPTLLIEIEERHNPGGLARIAAGLTARDYCGYYFSRAVRRPLADFIPDRDQPLEAMTTIVAHHRRRLDYINNFLFVPVERAAGLA